MGCFCHHTVIPQILADAKNIIGTWGESGTMDPFNQVYEVFASPFPHIVSQIKTKNSSANVPDYSPVFDLPRDR
jgi:hypothetical protein